MRTKNARMKVKFRRTSRGFVLGEFVDAYGAACSIQESSWASEQAIWFGADKCETDSVTGEHMTARMHLTREQVASLLPVLTRFAETGELGEPD